MIRIHFRASFVVVGCVRGRDGGVDARAFVRSAIRIESRSFGLFEARRGGEIEDAGKARRLTVRKT